MIFFAIALADVITAQEPSKNEKIAMIQELPRYLGMLNGLHWGGGWNQKWRKEEVWRHHLEIEQTRLDGLIVGYERQESRIPSAGEVYCSYNLNNVNFQLK